MNELDKLAKDIKAQSQYDNIVLYRAVIRLEKLSSVKDNSNFSYFVGVLKLFLEANISYYYRKKILRLEKNRLNGE